MTDPKIEIPLCPICGNRRHQAGVITCPVVQEIQFFDNGSIRKVVKR